MSPVRVGPTVPVATEAGHREVPALLRMVTPLPGLPGRTEYALEALDEVGVLFAIRSAPEAGPQVRLFLVAPHIFFPSYDPRIDTSALDEPFGPSDPDSRVLFVVVRPAEEEGHPPTANLLAPLVVDTVTGRAVQLVLDEDLPLQAPVG
ncbi:flagellar assembly protein FliW [Cellulomonas citrea]|uniref:flagellar assembly protein FliW n=1 Tax=Cellulomonas citrea TaxID=1909423 RepID=UPI001359B330|nr:flagellar assembly protein FliW [Cellulomonas citrea]